MKSNDWGVCALSLAALSLLGGSIHAQREVAHAAEEPEHASPEFPLAASDKDLAEVLLASSTPWIAAESQRGKTLAVRIAKAEHASSDDLLILRNGVESSIGIFDPIRNESKARSILEQGTLEWKLSHAEHENLWVLFVAALENVQVFQWASGDLAFHPVATEQAPEERRDRDSAAGGHPAGVPPEWIAFYDSQAGQPYQDLIAVLIRAAHSQDARSFLAAALALPPHLQGIVWAWVQQNMGNSSYANYANWIAETVNTYVNNQNALAQSGDDLPASPSVPGFFGGNTRPAEGEDGASAASGSPFADAESEGREKAPAPLDLDDPTEDGESLLDSSDPYRAARESWKFRTASLDAGHLPGQGDSESSGSRNGLQDLPTRASRDDAASRLDRAQKAATLFEDLLAAGALGSEGDGANLEAPRERRGEFFNDLCAISPKRERKSRATRNA